MSEPAPLPPLAWALLIGVGLLVVGGLGWLHVRAFASDAPAEGVAALAKLTEVKERVGLKQAPTTRLAYTFTATEGPRAGEVVEAAIEVDPRVAAPLEVGGYVDVLYDPAEPTRTTLAGGRGAPIDRILVVVLDVIIVVLAVGGLWRMRRGG